MSNVVLHDSSEADAKFDYFDKRSTKQMANIRTLTIYFGAMITILQNFYFLTTKNVTTNPSCESGLGRFSQNKNIIFKQNIKKK